MDDPLNREVNDFYLLGTETFQDKQNKLIIRLTLVLANILGIGNEVLSFESPKCPFNYPPGAHGQNCAQQDSKHLQLMNPSVIFGGIMKPKSTRPTRSNPNPNEDKITPQLPHVDFPDKNNTTVSVSSNPHFLNKHKPSSLIIPLKDDRKIIMYKKVDGKLVPHEVKATRGEVLSFGGDVVHSGATYKDIDNHHACVHFYLYSDLHDCDLNFFDISLHHILSVDEFKEYLPHIKADALEDNILYQVTQMRRTLQLLEGNRMMTVKMAAMLTTLADELYRLAAENN